jgi:uncharacterized membrane protein
MYQTLLIVHFLGLALGVGTGFANLRLGLATKDMDPAERGKFFMTALALSKNGSLGLALLILSGLAMMFLRGTQATFTQGGGALHAKLTLVLVMCGLLGYMQVLVKRVREAQGGPNLAKLPQVGRMMLIVSVLTVISAVLAFH